MSRFNLYFLPGDGGSPTTGGGLPAEGPENVTSSLADLIVGFDISPYLNEPLRGAWNFLQAYPLMLAIVLVALGYGLGWVLKSLIHNLLDRFRKSNRSEMDYQIAHFLTAPVLQTTVTFSLVLALATLDFPGAIETLLIKICITA